MYVVVGRTSLTVSLKTEGLSDLALLKKGIKIKKKQLKHKINPQTLKKKVSPLWRKMKND